MKKILASEYWLKRYGARIKLIPKWTSKINVYQQEHIIKATTAYTQVMENIISYNAPGIIYIDALISDKNKTTPCQVILGLKGLTENNKEENIFFSIVRIIMETILYFIRKNFTVMHSP